MKKREHTFPHKRPRNVLVAWLLGWRKINIEDVPVGAAFSSGRVGKDYHACLLLEPWREWSEQGATRTFHRVSARCRVWHVILKSDGPVECDLSEPFIFTKGNAVWTFVPRA